MAYVGNPIDTQNTFQSLVGKRFNGDGSTTDFTLDVAPSSTLDIEVFVGNVRQDPNSAYTLSGTTLSFTGAPPSGTNNIYVVHQAKSVGTIGIPDDTISARTLVTADSSADHVLIEDATDGELKKALFPSGFSVSSITGATALTATPATTDELVLSDAGTLKRMDFDHIFNTPAFIVQRTGGNINVNNNTYTKLEFDNEILDTNSAFGSNKFTVPTGEAGKYQFIAGCGTQPPGSGARSGIAFYKNGSLVEHGRMRDADGGTANDSMLNAAVILSLSADDYIEVYVRHNKGSDLSYYDDNMYFAGYKLIGV